MPRPAFLDTVLCRSPSDPDWCGVRLAWLQALSNDLPSIRLSDDERKAEIAFCYGRCVVIIFLHFLDLAQSSGAALARRVVSEFPPFVAELALLVRPTQPGVAGVRYELDVGAVVGAGPAPAATQTVTKKKKKKKKKKKGSPRGRK